MIMHMIGVKIGLRYIHPQEQIKEQKHGVAIAHVPNKLSFSISFNQFI